MYEIIGGPCGVSESDATETTVGAKRMRCDGTGRDGEELSALSAGGVLSVLFYRLRYQGWESVTVPVWTRSMVDASRLDRSFATVAALS